MQVVFVGEQGPQGPAQIAYPKRSATPKIVGDVASTALTTTTLTASRQYYIPPLADIIGDGRKATWTVTARQLRLALRAVGLRDAVEQAIAASGVPEMYDWWEYSTEYDRYHPIVTAMLPVLSTVAGSAATEAMADDVWALAETL